MKDQVTAAIKEFFRSGIMPEGVNGTVIVLIPKIDNPVKLTDFRPISLIHDRQDSCTEASAADERIGPALPECLHPEEIDTG